MIFDEYTLLHELVNYVSEPHSLEERALRLKESCDKISAFKSFIYEAYKPTRTFVTALNEGPMEFYSVSSKKRYAYGMYFPQIMSKSLDFWSDQNDNVRVNVRYIHLVSEMDELEDNDANIILALIRGDIKEEYLERLDKVVGSVFPELAPEEKPKRGRKKVEKVVDTK